MHGLRLISTLVAVWLGLAATFVATAGDGSMSAGFVNWESPHVHPLDLTPDGRHLLVANTADHRLEIFRVDGGGVRAVGAVPVGLAPVSVRARNDDEAWVVNRVSDSVSVVDLVTQTVVRTIRTGDEPGDVVFAGTPQRAFVSVGTENAVWVFDPDALTPVPEVLPIAGVEPRALATDGTRVWAAIFSSGNATTILDRFAVNDPSGPYAGTNPPPNDGAGFAPPLAPDLPAAPRVGLIVRRGPDGVWRDDAGTDWSAFVTWDLADHDVAVIDANTRSVAYIDGLMTMDFALAVAPDGGLLVVGVEAHNEIRFEPNLNGRFMTVTAARLGPDGTVMKRTDLNPHLAYDAPAVPPAERMRSIGDPRGVAFAPDGRAFVTGMGSNNLVVLDGVDRSEPIQVGQGPTGIRFDVRRNRLYVLNRFDGSLSIVDPDAGREVERIGFFDPTPEAIRTGRPFLYDTILTSGTGHVSCASCHTDGRMDPLAWDLGDPSGTLAPMEEICDFGNGDCEDFHPMKGPMVTQTLVGIVGTEPFHWRGDKADLAAFNGAFVHLLGRETELTEGEMAAFEGHVASMTMPPNPYRALDGSLRSDLPEGDAIAGHTHFLQTSFGDLNCVHCHQGQTGTNGFLSSGGLLQQPQSLVTPQLRNLYRKRGFDRDSSASIRGFGFAHDGATASLLDFLQFPGFEFPAGREGQQQRADLVAFLLSFSTDTPAGVGAQVTINNTGSEADPEAIVRWNALLAAAPLGTLDVIAHGRVDGTGRGFVRDLDGFWLSDRFDETYGPAEMAALVAGDGVLTFMLVPLGSGRRLGIDRDGDGFFDGDERDACSDPTDPASTPETQACRADITRDGVVAMSDLLEVLSGWGTADPQRDVDCSGIVGLEDLAAVLAAWGACDG